jgi:hypothetical protein
VGRDDQRPTGCDVAVFGDGVAEALGDLGPWFPAEVVDALDILPAELTVVALPGLGAPGLIESPVIPILIERPAGALL